MKSDDISVGVHKVGPFNIGVELPVFQSLSSDLFEVFVSQEVDGLLYYVDLVGDDRFCIFHHLTSFVRKITDADLAEYNAHVSSVFHKIAMPTFKLHRSTIVSLFDTCQILTKKMKKKR